MTCLYLYLDEKTLFMGLLQKLGKGTDLGMTFFRVFSYGQLRIQMETIILWCVRWYGSTPMSYANLSDMLTKRGISVNRSTIYRWFIQYGTALRKKLRRYQFIRIGSSWQLDKTYVKGKGKWYYLYRAINKHGETLDFYFSHKEAVYQALPETLQHR